MNMTKQRLMGLVLVAISALVLLLASTGETPEDRDATVVLLILPLGIYMMVTKQYVLYDGDTEEAGPDREAAPPEHIDDWAPTSPGAMSGPLYPFDYWGVQSTTYKESGKEFQNGKETDCRGPRLQDVGGSRRRAPGDR